MRKFWLILFIALIIIGGLLLFKYYNNQNKMFYLNDKYYEKSALIEVDPNQMETLINDKETFAVLVHVPEECSSCINFKNIVNEFLDEYKISIYSINFKNIDGTKISKYVKFTPSVVIFNKGKIVAYLDAVNDDDLPFYQTKEGFKTWFNKYVYLNKI